MTCFSPHCLITVVSSPLGEGGGAIVRFSPLGSKYFIPNVPFRRGLEGC
jgi:hypothetical protein